MGGKKEGEVSDWIGRMVNCGVGGYGLYAPLFVCCDCILSKSIKIKVLSNHLVSSASKRGD